MSEFSGAVLPGQRGETIVQASIAHQLTRNEVIELCNFEELPQEFVSLCLDLLRARSQAA
jgi:hypothetical protein